MKKLILTALVLLTTFCLNAQALTLETVCGKLAEHPHTTGLFNQTKSVTSKGKTRNLKSSGTFIFSVDGVMWNTLKPFPSTLIVTKTQMIQGAADGTETAMDMSSNETFSSIANTLLAIFSCDLTLLNESFTVDFTDNKNGTYAMLLSPKKSSIASVMKSILIEGKCTSEATMESITITELSENTINYIFSEQKYPKELSADDKNFFRIR